MMRPRREFPSPVKREMLDRSGGKCECHRVPQLPTYGVGCGVLLGPGNTFHEHIIPDALDGPNTAEFGACLCKTCWRLKTDVYDLPVIAEAKRQHDRQFSIGGPGRGRSPMRGGRHSTESRGMDGRVKVRKSLTRRLVEAVIIDRASVVAARCDDDRTPAGENGSGSLNQTYSPTNKG
jgi:hypothetical protein